MKKKLWKIWQHWLVISIPVNVISAVICGCMLDSKSHIPMIVLAINLAWLFILVEANAESKNTKRKDKETDEINNSEFIDSEFQGDKAANLRF